MNSGLRPLSKDIPFKQRASLMVKRGEAKTFGEACAMMRRVKKAEAAPPAPPASYRPLYSD